MVQILRKGIAKVLPGLLVFAFVIGTWQIMPTREVKAAAGEGAATISVGTGGSDAPGATYDSADAAGTVTVGTQSYLKIDLTVGASHIVADQNNVTFQINTNLFPANSWELAPETAPSDLNVVGEWVIDYTDVSSTTNNASITFAASAASNTGLITIQANQQMDSTDKIRIWCVVKDSNYSRAAANIVIQTDDTGANDLATITTPPTIATIAADAGATVTFANPVVGAVANTTLNLTLPVVLQNTDTIEFDFPTYVNIAGATVLEDSFAGAGSFGTTISTQHLTLTVSGGTVTAGTGTITLTGITGRYAGSTGVTNLEIESLGNASNDIATDSSVALTSITAGVINPTFAFSGEVVSNSSVTTTMTLTLPTDLDANDTVEITFPAYFDIRGVTFSTETFDGGSTFIDCVDTAQLLVCRSGGAITAGTGNIVMLGMKFYYAGTAPISLVQVQDEGADTDIIGQALSAGSPAITAAGATATVVLANNSLINQVGATTITLTTPFALDPADSVVITLPGFMNITGDAEVATGTFDDAGATITCDDAAQVLTCTVSVGATATTGTIILQNITSSYAGATDITSFLVADEGNTSFVIASDTDVALTNTTRGSSSSSGGSSTVTSTTPVVTLTAPIGGADLTGGDVQNVTWTTSGSGIDTVGIYYSDDNGSTYNQVAYNVSQALGTYAWTLPSIDSETVLVKIIAYDSGKGNLDTDVSTALSISTALEDVVTPAPGEEYTTTDENGRTVALDSGETGPSPVTGLDEAISTVVAGQFVRSYSFTTIYYIDENLVRHPFWDSNSFFTYADSFDEVVWVTDATLPTMTLGTPMLPKAGVVLVKITSDAKTYAIDSGDVLRWVPSEAIANTLYGATWSDYIIDLEPTIFARFTVGDDMTASDSVDLSLMKTRMELAEATR